MKIKSVMKAYYFSLALLLMGFSAFSQTKRFSNPKNDIPATLFTIGKSDTIVVSNIEKLGKVPSENLPTAYKVNLLSKSFNWSKDAWRAQNFKEMVLDTDKQDFCGRYLSPDVHTEVIQCVYLTSPNER